MSILAHAPGCTAQKNIKGTGELNSIHGFLVELPLVFVSVAVPLKAAAKPKAVEKPSSSAPKDEVPKDYVLFVFLC